MLAHHFHSAQSILITDVRPTLIWLHGLLGDKTDWISIHPYFLTWDCLMVDLPGHGESQDIQVNNFFEMDQLLLALIQHYQLKLYVLIGYSLGGRCAMHFACHHDQPELLGLIIEGGNLGIQDQYLRRNRLKSDLYWAVRFRQEQLYKVLHDWYCQKVFSDLSPVQRAELIEKRAHNDGEKIAFMLEATSLAKQPWLGSLLQHQIYAQQIQFGYIVGEFDHKFQHMAHHFGLELKIVPQAGHNTHWMNPVVFSEKIQLFLKEFKSNALSK